MFNFLKKKADGQTATFSIAGMHCTSCAMNIDGELEAVDGVKSAQTSYAKSATTVVYDPAKVSRDALKQVIESLEYAVKED